MSSKKLRRKDRPLFHPREIAIQISEALKRDLDSVGEDRLSEHQRYYRRVQKSEILKKFSVDPGQLEELEARTFEKFLKVNAHMAGQLGEIWVDGRINSNTPLQDKILLRAKALMRFVLTDFTESEWFQECRNSSGSSLGVRFEDTSPEAKFTYPITMTKRVAPLMDRYLLDDPRLSSAIEKLNRENPVTGKYSFVDGSRATTVEKNDTIRRMICVEPTGNMLFQQGLMSMMFKRMAFVGLDVESLPTAHKLRAMFASVSGLEATLDWTSASDCVSIELLRWLLPPRWFYVCDMVRCSQMSIAGHQVNLNMFSTMGNAVTFPLETLVLWTLAHACRLSLDSKRNTLFPEWDELMKCSVFGDDCIVETHVVELFTKTAERYGFILNEEKSFSGGPGFRESCGGDYLHGRNVRPFHLRSPTGVQASSLEPWLYIVANRLLEKYIQYFGVTSYVYDKALWRLIFALFDQYKLAVKLVPDHYPDDAGLKISNDFERFRSSYQATFDKIGWHPKTQAHGFKFMRFVFRSQRRMDEDLRLALWLRRPTVSSWFSPTRGLTELHDASGSVEGHFTGRRRLGGYVVAKGVSSNWTIVHR